MLEGSEECGIGQVLGIPEDSHCNMLSDVSQHLTPWLMGFLPSLWVVSMEMRCHCFFPPSFPLAVLSDVVRYFIG